MTNGELTIEEINAHISQIGGTATEDDLSDCGIYCINLDKTYTFSELTELTNKLEQFDFIDTADINPVIEVERN
jgi:hypothetical protein